MLTGLLLSAIIYHVLNGYYSQNKNKAKFKGGKFMKFFKKKLAMMLALTMLLTSFIVPMTSFAASTNTVDKVPSVTDDYDGWTAGTAPKLRIEEKNNDEFGDGTHVFRLQLTNAEWETQADLTAMIVGINAAATSSDIEIDSLNRISDTIVEVSMTTHNTPRGTKEALAIPLLCDVTAAGQVQVTVLPVDSPVSGGTFTFANATGGDTVATISKVEKFSNFVDLPAIIIDETSIAALAGAGKSIKLRLPNGFEWADQATIAGGGGYATAAANIQINGNNVAGGVAINDGDYASNVVIDGRDLNLTNMTFATVGTRGSVVLTGLQVIATSSAKPGEVNVTLRGSLTEQTLLVAEYVDYAVTAKADGDPKEIYAGAYEQIETGGAFGNNWTGDRHKLQKIEIKEETEGAWLLDRRKTRIEFPAEVKILDVVATGLGTGMSAADFQNVTLGKNYVEYASLTPANPGSLSKVKLEFYVSVKADYEGDIVATVSGTAIGNSQNVVLGEAIKPGTITATVKDVQIGKKDQAIGDITIQETKAEAFLKDGIIAVSLGKYMEWSGVPTIKVAEGDIDLDIEAASVTGNTLSIRVKSESSKASKIEITNAKADVDRTVPEGDYKVSLGGSAMVNNNTTNSTDLSSNGGFDEGTVSSAVVTKVITPAPGETMNKKVVFTIGANSYTVDGIEVAADVAPFIQDSRTMVPVRFVAQALGVAEENIIWDGTNRTVTILGDKIVQLTIGSNTMLVNGAAITMDTTAIISNDRTFVPIAWIAKALGVEYTWDQATKSVTFN